VSNYWIIVKKFKRRQGWEDEGRERENKMDKDVRLK
jgi:hypothetical protein